MKAALRLVQMIHGGALVSTGIVGHMESEPRALYRATTGKNNN